VRESGSRDNGLGIIVKGLGLKIQDLRVRVQGSRFRVFRSGVTVGGFES